ncbi:hypothetical protein CF326_g5425 [Tilletia indica]|nr:hypothetical protein CF326_g5425 [Tilletia indica]
MSAIPQRELGNTGVKLPAIGYGAMGLAAFYGKPKPQSDVDACLSEIIKQGVKMIDTSDIYTDFSTGKMGLNEEQIARFLKANPEARKNLFIATKFAFRIAAGGFETKGDREYVLKACQDSLDRLQIDQIDLYYAHRPTDTPVEETVGAMKELQDAGKIRFIGVSEYTVEQLEAANKVAHIDAYQIEVSPFTPEIFENGLADWCEKNGTAIVAYSPLGRGFITRTINSPEDFEEGDFRKNSPRYEGENFKKNLELVDALEHIGKAKGHTAGQIAIAWVLHKSKNVIPIPGSTKPERIAENVVGAKIELSKEDLKEIDDIIKSFNVSGARYPAGMTTAF